MITFALVRYGNAYSIDYVVKMRNMIERHYVRSHKIICLTDDSSTPVERVQWVDVRSFGLPKWWSKMLLFSPFIRGGGGPCIYLDLDTIILNDLTPLCSVDADFAICANFTRAAGHPTWPCKYGSCVMHFAPTFGSEIYKSFMDNAPFFRSLGSVYGDQYVIEKLLPKATLLQDVLPPRFFINYRYFKDEKPASTLAIFAGKNKPHTSTLRWVKDAWN